MKKIVVLILVLSNCFVYAQRKPKIKGNRTVTEVREVLPPFNAIALNDDLEITLQKSSDPGYFITADDNLIDVLKLEVVDSTLVISSFYKITAKKKLEITVNYTELEGITMREGKIGMQDILNSDKLYVNTFGYAILQLSGSASIMSITMEENSTGDFNLDSDSLNITLKDKVNAQIYSVGEKSTLEMHKNASAIMEGTTDSLQVKLTGNANLKAEKLEAATIVAKLEESVNARFYAYKNFELSSSGTSRTHLYGDPKVTILEFLDTSALFKKEE
ncbi:MAG: DUF2807 domain-containing protein [Saonia sp.]